MARPLEPEFGPEFLRRGRLLDPPGHLAPVMIENYRGHVGNAVHRRLNESVLGVQVDGLGRYRIGRSPLVEEECDLLLRVLAGVSIFFHEENELHSMPPLNWSFGSPFSPLLNLGPSRATRIRW